MDEDIQCAESRKIYAFIHSHVTSELACCYIISICHLCIAPLGYLVQGKSEMAVLSKEFSLHTHTLIEISNRDHQQELYIHV